MKKGKAFWVKLGAGLAGLGIALGLGLTGKLPLNQMVELIGKSLDQLGGLVEDTDRQPAPAQPQAPQGHVYDLDGIHC